MPDMEREAPTPFGVPSLTILATTEYRGQTWGLMSVSKTFDGFKIGHAVVLDDSGEPALDDDGNMEMHDFFLG